MPRLLRAALVLTAFLAAGAPARAGVYFVSIPSTNPRLGEVYPLPTAQTVVTSRLGTLTGLDDRTPRQKDSEGRDKVSPERKALLKWVDEDLEPKRKKGELTSQDRVN